MLSIQRQLTLDPPQVDPMRLLNLIEIPVDWIGLRIVKIQQQTRSVRDGQPQGNGTHVTYGAMVEVLVDGQIGYGATNRLNETGIRQAALSAYHQAQATQGWGLYPFNASVRPRVVGEYGSRAEKPFDALSPGEITDLLVRICYTLKTSDAIVQTLATAIATEHETWFVSSNGSEVYQRQLNLGTDFAATAKDGSITQRRSDSGWFARAYQGGWELLTQADLWERVQLIGQQATELLYAPECPDTTTTLVLAPDQMMLQLHESVGHPLEIDRILGDERNYAGGSFVKASDFGHLTYGSPLMNVTFDPSVEAELASYQFDDTGAEAQRQYLIREGRLERGLGSLESQTRSGLEGVSCARACSWNRPAIDRMANINLEPGDTSPEDLIGQIEQGIYMEANRSWSIDDLRHKFQFGCEYAKRIENGRLTETLRNPNYRATTPQFWQSLVAVGDRSTWQVFGTPMCGKGEPNQIIWVGHAAPICAFREIEVFGGGE